MTAFASEKQGRTARSRTAGNESIVLVLKHIAKPNALGGPGRTALPVNAAGLNFAIQAAAKFQTNGLLGLLDFDLRSSGFDLFLDLFRFLFGDPFFDRFRSTFHQGFRFGES